eukprot:GHVN01076169.1.p1 GENE.GHVN01076169.1~~GHVN01076169.1.p1  ORF type:complete len:257 (+),score=46.39 GHVN01076169.1:117-773(+)
MADYGCAFAHWLRDKLMKRFGFFHVRSVYLDAVVSRNLGETEHYTDLSDKDSEKAMVGPDRRIHMIHPTTGSFLVGAKRNDWEELFNRAVSEAKVMIFVFTAKFLESAWCVKEWHLFLNENERRKRSIISKKKPITGIILDFTEERDCLKKLHEKLENEKKQGLTGYFPNLNAFRIPVTQYIPQARRHSDQPFVWEKGYFILSGVHFERLAKLIEQRL